MHTLVTNWHQEFSAYELAKAAKVTAPMAYHSIDTFAKYNLITKSPKVKINFNCAYAYQFKLLHDAEKFAELPQPTQDIITRIQQVMHLEYQHHLRAFLIFGSVASGETNADSDIDVLAITIKKKDIDYKKRGLLTLGKVNIIEKEQEECEKDYALGHDFMVGALVHGIILYDTGVIKSFLQKSLPKPSPEIILHKKEQLDLLKARLLRVLKDQDYLRLEEEFKHYLIEKGRVLLLEQGTLPRSKKDIILKIKNMAPDIYKLYSTVNQRNIKITVLRYV